MNHFSAGRFLNKIKEAFIDDQIPSEELVRSIYDDYIKSLKSVWDTSKADYLTKKALFEEAINDFIDQGIYKRINTLCTFTDAKADVKEAKLN